MKRKLFLVVFAVIAITMATAGGTTEEESPDKKGAIVLFDGVEEVLVEGGSFPRNVKHNDANSATFDITLDSFYMGTTEVTQKQYLAVMGYNPSNKQSSTDLPVEMVSWFDAVKFCNTLTEKENEANPDKTQLISYYTITGKGNATVVTIADTTGGGVGSGNGYRLPTEAEWEYAAGGGNGTRTTYAGTDVKSVLGTYAAYDRSDNKGIMVVKSKTANRLGLYDMSGNVYEWCWDESDYPVPNFSSEALTNPIGPDEAEFKAYRGGAYYTSSERCLVTFRTCDPPETTYGSLGFRVVRSQ